MQHTVYFFNDCLLKNTCLHLSNNTLPSRNIVIRNPRPFHLPCPLYNITVTVLHPTPTLLHSVRIKHDVLLLRRRRHYPVLQIPGIEKKPLLFVNDAAGIEFVCESIFIRSRDINVYCFDLKYGQKCPPNC